MKYNAPGLVSGASEDVLKEWNAIISRELANFLKKPILMRATEHIVSPDAINTQPTSIHWTADPAEPRFCLDESWAQKLSDWGIKGRHLFQNEYCEYSLVTRVDKHGRVRIKRFTATTELAEWWTNIASIDPEYLKASAEEVLGRSVSFDELYGSDVGDPNTMSAHVRRVRFAKQVAGNGYNDELINAKVPQHPEGDINRNNALFMTHPINGLDDLLYIVIFGAQPYVVKEEAGYRPARLFEIFNAQNATHLACRNADPAAAQGAFSSILKKVSQDGKKAWGSKIAFANPLGMYFISFQWKQIFLNDVEVPNSWVKFSRGSEGLYQRLEFGPTDEEDVYLDEAVIKEGASESSISGGYQLAKLIEVGPKMLIGPEIEFVPNIFELPASTPPDCGDASICIDSVRPAKDDYEMSHGIPGLRGR